MTSKICVYTCITGNYDNLHEIDTPEPGVDYYCFTNNRNIQSNTWKIVYIEDKSLSNHLLSRKIKMLGHPIISENYDISLWMDAQIIWRKSIKEFVEKYFKNTTFAAFKHSQRHSIHEEAIACLRYRKDTKERITRALEFLERERFPDNLGLYEMTVFIKKHNDPKVIETMEQWFYLVSHYSKRDQLSFMYCIWKTGLKVKPINLNVWDNIWFYPQSHTPDINIDNCHIYYGNPDTEFDINKYFIHPYKHIKNSYQISTIIPIDTKEIELDLSNYVGLSYTQLEIEPKPVKVIPLLATQYNDKTIFCTDRNILKIYGNFKKNNELYLNINLKLISPSLSNILLGHLYLQNTSLNENIKELQKHIEELNSTIKSLDQERMDILNSRGWKYLERFRRIIPH